jgi:hypothetical protein
MIMIIDYFYHSILKSQQITLVELNWIYQRQKEERLGGTYVLTCVHMNINYDRMRSHKYSTE